MVSSIQESQLIHMYLQRNIECIVVRLPLPPENTVQYLCSAPIDPFKRVILKGLKVSPSIPSPPSQTKSISFCPR